VPPDLLEAPQCGSGDVCQTKVAHYPPQSVLEFDIWLKSYIAEDGAIEAGSGGRE
jgi:hypothetical protein